MIVDTLVHINDNTHFDSNNSETIRIVIRIKYDYKKCHPQVMVMIILKISIFQYYYLNPQIVTSSYTEQQMCRIRIYKKNFHFLLAVV